jgi:serine phosphatase RsbU (regulator of sigma subunit)
MGIGRDFKIARTIERLNRILNKSRLTTKFVSLFYAEFETNGEIVYVNAGHPSPFLLGSAGAFQELPSSGMVLGPSPDATYARRAAKMEPGDILVMYSDGIIEAHDGRGREFGIARLRKLVAEFRKRPAREIAELVLSGVRAYTSGRMAEDDQTIVIVRRKPSPKRSSASGEFPAITNVRLGRS